MKFAYADPPYIGQARKHYKCAEVNHQELINKLELEYDGWALSCSSPSLRILLAMCPEKTRVMGWVKPFCIFKPGVNPAYAWEPILVYGNRPRSRYVPTVRDWVSVNVTLKKGLVGAKPREFCLWLFEILNLELEDTLDDLFPGTGIVTRTFEEWKLARAREDK